MAHETLPRVPTWGRRLKNLFFRLISIADYQRDPSDSAMRLLWTTGGWILRFSLKPIPPEVLAQQFDQPVAAHPELVGQIPLPQHYPPPAQQF